jgi:cytochrome bd-type quinol oxidase subunit 2
LTSWFEQFGILRGIASVAISAVLVAVGALSAGLPAAEPELFDHLAQAGIGLLIAFTVAIAGVGMSEDTPDEHGRWLGYGCGFALSALAGIAGCLALSSPSAHAGDALNIVCLAWSAVAFMMLGIVIAVSPLMIFRSNLPHRTETSSSSGERDANQRLKGAEGASGDVGGR